MLTRLGLLGLSATLLSAALAACGGRAAGSSVGNSVAAQTASTAPSGMSPTMVMPTGAPTAVQVATAGSPAAAAGGDSAPQPPNQVTIDNFAFHPQTVTVPAGTRVTWVNHDDVPHTVTSRDKGVFGSPALDTDQSFSFTFATAGTFAYYCAIHPIMTGQVIVQ